MSGFPETTVLMLGRSRWWGRTWSCLKVSWSLRKQFIGNISHNWMTVKRQIRFVQVNLHGARPKIFQPLSNRLPHRWRHALESGKIQTPLSYKKKTLLPSLLPKGVTAKLTLKSPLIKKKLLTLFNNEKKNIIFNKDRQYYGEDILKFLVLTFH